MDAWLDPEKATKFLFATPDGEMVRVEIDPRVGGRYSIDRSFLAVFAAKMKEAREMASS